MEAYIALLDQAALIPNHGPRIYDFANTCLFLEVDPQSTLQLLVAAIDNVGMIGMVFFDDHGIPYLTEKGAVWLATGKVYIP
jgi:hypothetical protein